MKAGPSLDILYEEESWFFFVSHLFGGYAFRSRCFNMIR
jgi:hypothetical protein